jgi:hypothetical protein
LNIFEYRAYYGILGKDILLLDPSSSASAPCLPQEYFFAVLRAPQRGHVKLKLRDSQFCNGPPNPPEGGLKAVFNLLKEFKSPPSGDLGGLT